MFIAVVYLSLNSSGLKSYLSYKYPVNTPFSNLGFNIVALLIDLNKFSLSFIVTDIVCPLSFLVFLHHEFIDCIRLGEEFIDVARELFGSNFIVVNLLSNLYPISFDKLLISFLSIRLYSEFDCILSGPISAIFIKSFASL